jgi:hypothetical protein
LDDPEGIRYSPARMKRLPGGGIAACCNVIVRNEIRLVIVDNDETGTGAQVFAIAKRDNEQ